MKKLFSCLLAIALVHGSLQASTWFESPKKWVTHAANYGARTEAIKSWWEVSPTSKALEDYVAKVKTEGVFWNDDAIKQDLVNAQNEFGETRLHLLAQEQGHALEPSVLESLVKLGANLSLTDDQGNTAVDFILSKDLPTEHALYKVLATLGALKPAATSSSDDETEVTEDDDEDDEKPSGSTGGGSGGSGDDADDDLDDKDSSEGSDDSAGTDSDDDTDEIDSDDESSEDTKDAGVAATQKKSILTPKNALITLGIAGVVGIGYYFYDRSSKKSTQTSQKATQMS